MKSVSRYAFLGVAVLVLALVALGPVTAAAGNGLYKKPGEGTITSEFYGTTLDGQDVYEYTLTNANKDPMQVKIITYGGIITSIKVPGRQHIRAQRAGSSRDRSRCSPGSATRSKSCSRFWPAPRTYL